MSLKGLAYCTVLSEIIHQLLSAEEAIESRNSPRRVSHRVGQTPPPHYLPCTYHRVVLPLCSPPLLRSNLYPQSQLILFELLLFSGTLLRAVASTFTIFTPRDATTRYRGVSSLVYRAKTRASDDCTVPNTRSATRITPENALLSHRTTRSIPPPTPITNQHP